jgi:hypothetical protein
MKNSLKDLNKVIGNVGSTKTYGRIEGETLFYKGKYYKIRYVQPETLILDTENLFGKYGDEFPLELIK